VRAALKTAEQASAGEAFALDFAGSQVLLDPAGVAYFGGERILVVADMHLEKASSFARSRIYLPPYDTAATLARLAALVAKYDPATIISLGDAFHDDEASARLSDEAAETIRAIARGREMIWVTGNHDPSPPEGVPGQPVETVALGRAVFRHIPDPAEFGYEVCGHLHPSARIAVRGQTLRRPCFACDGTRLILPAFGAFTGGLNVRDDAFSALFETSRLRAYMLGNDKIYPVGPRMLTGD
jgi:DNA ligase-associated metallophosphoesterase